jgi:FAD/FMN-containing dehydrogenase
VEYRAHAGSGVAQIFVSNAASAEDVRQTVARWREIAHRGRGHLRVTRIGEEFRAGVSIFDEPPPAAFALMRRLKTAFDPRGIFNPGCFVGGL